jgi:4'-phosphopantetheinyl transferase
MPAVSCDSFENVIWNKEFKSAFVLDSTINIWCIRVSSNTQLINYFNTILSRSEQERALCFHQEKDRQQFIIGRGSLRYLLGKYSNQSPDAIQLITGKNKKPVLQNSGLTDLHFNVSHSGDYILIAIAGCNVGIDVEKIDALFSFTEILQNNFSEEEINFIQNAKQPRAFYLLWTRKEALIKATAKGLDDHLIFIPSLNGQHSANDEILGSDQPWTINSFEIKEEYIASVAYDPSIKTIRFWEADESLFFQPV